MKRIKNADINFKLNPKRINLNNFSMKFYTVNSEAYFFTKDQNNLVSVERDATIYDEDVIISGGTKVLDYYLPLDWSELVQLGEGVLNYRCINNIEDPYFPDMAYNQVVEDTTGYYIDSDIIVDPSQNRNIIERVSELESGLAVESIDREEADTAISGAVDSEIARAISAETILQEEIDELASGTSEALDAEIERAISAETAIRQDLTDESELRSSADTAMWTAVNDEITRSTSADTALDNKIDVETLRAIGVENAISGNLETYKATNNAALQAETTRATSAETALQTAIGDEATARANADAALGTRIDNISSASTAAIEAEAARAQEAESGLTTALNNEVSRATSAETIIANSLNAEINRASSAETALNNQIDAEVLRATAREAELEAKIGVVSGVTELINAETLRATTAEEALQTAIGNEVSARTDADTALDNKIDTVSGNVLTEEARAKGIEDILSGAIDTLDVRFFDDAKYENSGNTKVINFYNGNVVKATIDATDFIKDGMISGVTLESKSGTTYLVINWNTDAGIETTELNIGDIFEADNYYQKSETSGKTEIANALAEKLNISDFNTYSGAADTLINSKASQSDFTAHTTDSAAHITAAERTAWNAKADESAFTAHTSDSVIHVTSSDKEKWNKVDDKAYTTALTAVNDVLTAHTADTSIHLTSGDVTNLISDKADTTALTAVNNALTAHTNDSSIHLTSGDVQTQIDSSISGKANSSDVYLKSETSGATELATAFAATQPKLSAGTGIDITANVISVTGGGGGKAIEPGRGISVTTGETADTVSFNLPISAGTGTGALVIASDAYKLADKATGDYAVCLNGGDTYTNYAMARNSLAEGSNTRAYSINCHAEGEGTKAGDPSYVFNGKAAHSEGFYTTASGNYSHAEGYYTIANGNTSHAEGWSTSATSEASHAEGYYTKTTNRSEHSSGQYNVSNKANNTWGDSGNTLFSVGNGTADNARHNAFEIRQNGDIYITSGGTDIKLQDQLGGSGGISSAECQTMIDQSISGKADSDDVYTTGQTSGATELATAFAGKANSSDVYTKSETSGATDISTALADKLDATAYTPIEVSSAITSADTNPVQGGVIYDKFDEVEQVTARAIIELNNSKQSKLSAGTGISIDANNVISATGGTGGNPTVELTQAQYDALVTAGTVSADTYYIITDAQAGDLSQYWTSAQTQSAITEATSGKVDSSSVVTAVTSASTDNEIPTAKAVYDAIPTGGTGGGKAIEAGRGISVTTGETADTVSFNLPIYSNSDSDIICGDESSHAFSGKHNNNFITGYGHFIKGGVIAAGNVSRNSFFGTDNTIQNTRNTTQLNNSAVFGRTNYILNASYAFASGNGNQVNNDYEFASGRYNVSNTGSTDADRTLFSIGNGTADNARHNAFEIRQNGDIYISSGGTDIKLQDHLGAGGGGGSSYSAGTGIDITNDVISVTGMVETSAVTSAVTSGSTDVLTSGGAYEQFGGLKLVKLTQSAYDNLQTKDNNTLYVIVN